LDPVHLPPSFVVKMQNYRSSGTMAKLNLALDALPSFAAASHADRGPVALAGRIHIGAGIDYLERAFDHSKYGEFSRQPYLDVMIPPLLASRLAPPVKPVRSVFMQSAPSRQKTADWSPQRDPLRDTIITPLPKHAPALPSKTLAPQTIPPADL